MTWYLLAHILYKLYEQIGCETIALRDLENLLSRLWVEHNVVLYENADLLHHDLEILARFGIVRLNDGDIVLNLDTLKKLEDIISRDPLLSNNSTYLAYLKARIDKGLEHINKCCSS